MNCRLSAQLGASELIKQACGQTQQLLQGEELVYCLQTHKIWRTRFERNPDCRLPHRSPEHVELTQHPENVCLRDLMTRFGLGRETSHVTAELPWISRAGCKSQECERTTPIGRFARLLAHVGRCRCGAALIAGTRGQHSAIPVTDLRRNYDRPLSELGLQPGATVTISNNDECVHFYVGNPSIEEWVAANTNSNRNDLR
jgi:hypothetical protein